MIGKRLSLLSLGGYCQITNLFKDKEIIFVGRIDNMHKRPIRILYTWKILEDSCKDWRLTFIGDGLDRSMLEKKANELGLRRVSFEGFKNPVEYYKRASILMLTSDIEGFPLVLAECMSFGIVPVVYASYPAVSYIITDGIDGVIIPKQNRYPTELAAKKLSFIMENERLRLKMALAATIKSKEYSISTICSQWENTFENLEYEQRQPCS